VVADRAWRNLARGWSARGVVTFSGGEVPQAPGHADVLHLVGRPLAGSGGVVLQVVGAAERSKAQTVESAVRDSGFTVSPASYDLGGAALVVVQAEPLEPSLRLDSDREAAARLRVLADEAMTAGAETVIVVPALPPELAEEVVAALARRLGRMTLWESLGDWLRRVVTGIGRSAPTYRLSTLLQAVAASRAMIETWPGRDGSAGADPETYLELALDLALFTRVPPEEEAAPAPTAASDAPAPP
jgi:hypothetical protein